ncbi:MAG: ATP-binding protein [Candidatus Bipolaricaulia bacterium]
MKRQIPLSLKLSLSFAIIILLSVGLVYFLTARSITERFDELGRKQREILAVSLSSQLRFHYEQNGTWIGVDNLFYRDVPIVIGDEVYMGRTLNLPGAFILADLDGAVILYTVTEESLGRKLASNEIAAGIPIVVDDVTVGTLILLNTRDPSEAEFLNSAMRSAVLGGGIAIGLALILSVFLILQILSPLKKLTRATERIAHGDLPDSVRLRSHDELGQLGKSFDQMLANLKHSEALRQMMTADIAHELRTPVTIIQGTLEALIDGVYEPSSETIAPIYEETLHLGRLIDDLRDLALAEAGELRLEREPVDLEGLIRRITEAAVSSPDVAPTLRIDVEHVVPLVEADPKRLRQVIANLLSNALRHTPNDGEIMIGLRRASNAVEIVITDTGPGIAKEDLTHLFERFYRGDPARNRGGGSGLGLAIARQWVEAHGGTIRAENAPEGGARFTVRFPLA